LEKNSETFDPQPFPEKQSMGERRAARVIRKLLWGGEKKKNKQAKKGKRKMFPKIGESLLKEKVQKKPETRQGGTPKG